MNVVITLSPRDYDAVLFDLDGVLTRTASVHAAAWKKLFDGFLEKRAAGTGEPFVPFDIDADYLRYVDGKLRYDGVAAFLESRAIELPLGAPEDGPDVQSVSALGNLKDRYFLQHLEQRDGAFVESGNTGCGTVFEGDLVVHGAGRVANLDALALDAAGVGHSARGVVVNEFLQSVTNPRVYAIGDASATPLQLATTADMDPSTAAENILHGNRQRADYENVPRIVFMLPPLSGVGMTEAQAKKSGARFHINRGTMAGWASSRRIGQKHAFYKVLIEDETGRILGAHLFGHNAGEAINIFAMAMKFGISNLDLKKVLWA